jgi:hypothetical protein
MLIGRTVTPQKRSSFDSLLEQAGQLTTTIKKAVHTVEFRDRLKPIAVAPYDRRDYHVITVGPVRAAAGPRLSEVAMIAALGAGLPTPDSSSCSQLGETSRAMLVDGTDDPIHPYLGGVVTLFGFGNRRKAMSAKDSTRIFAERNGITTAPEIARMEPQKPDDPTSVEILT